MSARGMTQTVLATDLTAAVQKDEAIGEGYAMGSGCLGRTCPRSSAPLLRC